MPGPVFVLGRNPLVHPGHKAGKRSQKEHDHSPEGLAVQLDGIERFVNQVGDATLTYGKRLS